MRPLEAFGLYSVRPGIDPAVRTPSAPAVHWCNAPALFADASIDEPAASLLNMGG